ncbi:YeiH family protein [Tahibacter soli]|uniref:YeiH family protein n=1 Tax=Tahibacter soli TaxID=2983605 RepID=A0A9X3YPK1_9GAMM|nr:YeiH family protein [Tahibacter soli]MDC8015115.1 YeiH family protein [Tahibacter soli]
MSALPAVAAPPVLPIFRRFLVRAPGLALAGLLAAFVIGLADTAWFRGHGLGALTLAIVLGLVVGNTVYPRFARRASAGVDYSRQRLLRAGIVLYGLRLTFQDIGHVGVAGVAIDAAMLASTFGLAWFAGTRWFGLPRSTAILIGAGSSICGAAAVLATEPVVRARGEEVAVAVSGVVVFGTLAMFLYPLLYPLAVSRLGWSATDFGVYVGSTVHEVAQVVAAGRAVGEYAAIAAVIAKMVRVMMLAPFLVLLAAALARGEPRAERASRRVAVPWFALGFVAVAALNSLVSLPVGVTAFLLDLDTALLAMAMAGLGLATHVGAVRRAGTKPLALAALLFVWLVAGGAAVNYFFA